MNETGQALLEVLKKRFACKSFDPSKRVSDEDFHMILEAARLSPSSFGMEPWKFLVIENPELKKELAEISVGGRASLTGANRFVIILARKRTDLLADSDYVTHMLTDIHHLPPQAETIRRDYYRKFQTCDSKVAATDESLFAWTCRQTYIAMESMLLMAAALGIDSCPIEGFEWEEVNQLLIEKKLFDPAHFGVAYMAGFGYAKDGPKHQKTRQPLSDIVEYVK